MIRFLVSLTLATLAAGSVAAQDTSVAAYKDWSVFNPSSPRECYIVSPPVATEARRNGNVVSVSRGDIRLFVTIRPDQGVNKEISFTGGYPFKAGSAVNVEIGGQNYAMNSGSGEGEDWAWPPSPERDAEMIAAMRKGASAKITAVSQRGTTTIDSFSLLGFTAALEEAEKLCN